ncbi:RagB/SusD family nutrient uptake outer membrane protein [Pedobacter nyackensis]|uniref:RagB/SusD family nutrient uptake outer membrane protein n=1 Tax=Pedobacter nyackensis TaxID=475255 RepID=UPI0029307251|nr:RagB/SusD family nutrient uptake outer membrane protein [Pedobacter nyackensis]
MNTFKKIVAILILVVLASCKDSFLDRTPLSELTPEQSFTSEVELKAYTNAFYNQLPEALDVFYNSPYYGDDDARTTVPNEFRGTRTVPTTGGGWSWTELRRINFFLENSDKFKNETIRAKYNALARFFRAYFYFGMVQRFGDVPWYDNVLEIDDPGLTKARDTRQFVVGKMMEDLDYAIDNLQTDKHPQLITKWTALALKSRVALFEGTYRKYHGLAGWESLLDLCISASDQLMTQSGYKIYKSTADKAYQDLFNFDDANRDEMILARQYSASVPFVHSVNFYTLSVSFGRPGVSRHVINSYLNADGSRFTDNPNYKTMQWFEETQNRDPRLSQTIRIPGYKRSGESNLTLPDFASTITGYQYVKYVQPTAFDQGNCVNDMPIFRFAEVLLNFAEAKAERGTLTQTDLDRSVKLIRDRVAMPNISLIAANALPDPYMVDLYRNVSNSNKGVILEIRRERQVELIREGLRYYDLIRWKEGQIFSRVFNGMYFPGVGTYDIDHNGTIDLHIYEGTKPASVPGRQYLKIGEVVFENGRNGGQIITNPTVTKQWDESRDYLYPIPTQERLLNKALKQNEGWVDGVK